MSSRTSRPCPHSKGHKKQSVLPGLVNYFTHEKRSKRKPCMHSRSFTPFALQAYEDKNEARNISESDVINSMSFFDVPISTGSKQKLLSPLPVPRAKQFSQRTQAQKSSRKVTQSPAVEKRPEFSVSSREPDYDSLDGDIEWMPDFIEEMFDNSDRHAVGLGIVQQLFGTGDLDPNSPAVLERTKLAKAS